MNDAIDFSTLKWVKSELDETLKQARQALEAYVENPDDKDQLDALEKHLHQVYGTLQIVELYGAALLAEEMEQVAGALGDGRIAQREDVYDVLMRAILQLPDYLDRLVAGHRDIPLVLLPLLNDLRALRGENLLSESAMFSPDLTVPLPESVSAQSADGDIQQRGRDLRHKFQLSLLGFFRDQDAENSLESLHDIAKTLTGLCSLDVTRRFWWVGSGLIQALSEGGLDASAAVKLLLGRMDRVLKQIIESGEASVSSTEIGELTKNLLFYVGQSTTRSETISEIRSTYRLDALLPDADEITAARESLSGQNTELFKSVASVVKEELIRLKETLDVAIRNGLQKTGELQQLADSLKAMSDTLGMLGLGAQRKAILGKATELQANIENDDVPTETALMDVASTLLLVDSAMERMAQGQTVTVAEDADDIDASLAASEFDQVKEVVLNEAITDLVRAKEAIIEYMEGGEPGLVTEAIQLLGQVKGGMLLLDETRASWLVGSAARYVEKNMTDPDNQPSESELESLADAVCGVEYYLEGLRESRLFGDNAIDMAEQRFAELGYSDGEDDGQPVTGDAPAEDVPETHHELDTDNIEVPLEFGSAVSVADEVGEQDTGHEAAEQAMTMESDVVSTTVETAGSPVVDGQFDDEMGDYPVLGEDTDEEILEIFIEEAEEEMESIGENLPLWASNPDEAEALATVRRSFHTLKGSGRLIGAMRIGEFAWAFENLLNRVIDGTVQATPEMLDILRQSHEALPSLVAQIKNGTPLDKPVAWLMSAADALSSGDEVPVYAAAEGQTTAAGEPAEEPAAAEDAETSANEMDALPADAAVLDEVDAEPDAVQDEVPEAGIMDPVLYDIYRTETLNHFAVVDAFIEAGEERISEDLVRALHTLHGSANTASVEPVAAVAAKLEKYCKLLTDADSGLSERGLHALQQGRSLMGEMFEQLPGPISQPERLADYLRGMDSLHAEMEAEIAAAEAAREAEAARLSEMASEAEAAPVAEAEGAPDDPYAEFDQELIQIFLEEGGEIIERSESALASWRADPADTAALEQLQRELHTLKGGARMAELTPLGDLAHALESVIIHITENAVTADQAVLETIQSAHDQLAAQVDMISRRQPLQDNSELIERLDACQHTPVVEDMQEPVDYGDPELVDIFIEEASDILENSDATLQQWKSDPDNVELMASLQRELHTLKGGARMADITAIGDLAHGVESLMVMLAEGELQPGEGMFSVLEQAQDRLVSMVINVRNREPVASATELMQKLEALRNGEVIKTPVAATRAKPAEAGAGRESAKIERRAQPRETHELVRVRADLLDEMVNNAGEVSIYRSRLEQQVGAYRFNLVEMEQTVVRLREQLRKLEIETEAQILFRYEKEIDESATDFDPLEMDRYSQLQQLSRSLMESVADLTSIQNLLENITRESETLLLQQSRVNTDLQEGLMRTRMVPFLGLSPRMRRIVRQTASELGKKAELELSGAEGELDRTVIDRIIAPIEHMLRNAISHGIETPEQRREAGKPESGTIKVTFEREASDIVLRLTDDGAGINLENVRRKAIERGLMDSDSNLSDNDVLQFILETGFSTAQQVTQVSGRGVGMDVVNSEVKQLGGSLHIASKEGQGTTFTIRLPFTLAINQALLVEVGDDPYAIPLSNIQGIVRIERGELEKYYADPASHFEYGGTEYEVRHLGNLLGTHKPNLEALPNRVPVLLAKSGDQAVALQVENLLGSREIVVKSVGPQISTVRGVSGATILGDGRVVMILDVAALLRSGMSMMAQVEEIMQRPLETEQVTVMVVDDSITVRKVTSRLLERNDMQVITAKDGVDAVSKLHETVPDIMLLDIEMPRMDGFELATHVRNEERLKHVPIIMITSRTGDKHRQRAMEIGVNNYLGKPFQEAELLETIQCLLRSK